MGSSSRLFVSYLYCAAFAGLGLVIASLGPILLALQVQVGAQGVDTFAYVFTIRSVGYLVGACVGGYGLDQAPEKGHLLMATGLLCTAVALVAIPLASSVRQLGGLVSVQGFAMGILDTIGNTLLIFLYDGMSSGPLWMQAMHCSFGLGAFICPLVVEAAMSHSQSGLDYAPAFYFFASWLTATSLVLCGFSPSLPDRALGGDTHDRMKSNKHGGGKYDKVESDERVDVLDAEEIRPKESEEDDRVESDESVDVLDAEEIKPKELEQDAAPRRFKREHVVAMTALVLGLYVGVETGFGGYLLYFAHEECDLSQRDGQYITSVYWGSLALGRCMAIPLSHILTPKKLLAFDMVVSLLSAILLLGGQCRVLWYGSGFLGFGLASVFPAVVSLVETFIDVTAKSSSIFMVGAAAGEMLIPFGMGLWTAAWHPGFLVASASAITLCAGASAVLVFVGATMPKSQRFPPMENSNASHVVLDHTSQEGLELRTL
jgi:FHS family Na+ dependent glucose MFS transporter 1